jgi:NTP pyrophosphatase (non-canonical NTP hydrolase)
MRKMSNFDEMVENQQVELHKDLIRRAYEWASARGILDQTSPHDHLKKMYEELEEFQESLTSGNFESARIELGDLMVTCIIMTKLLESSFEHCLGWALAKNEGRTGKMIDGVWVHDR